MKATAFQSEKDLPPIPITEALCRKALELKEHGLKWEPHVGCFVWDPEETIPAPSPFGGRIYFILNLNRFLQFYSDIESMKNRLVWLPTWHQAGQILGSAGKSNSENGVQRKGPTEEPIFYGDSENDFIRLYDRVIAQLHSV